MDRRRAVFVKCMLSRGAFPHERAFVIRFSDGLEYRGIVPATYCFTADGRPMGEDPIPGDQIQGKMLGLLFDRNKEGIAKVELPDGGVYELTEEQLTYVNSAEASPCVPVQS